MCGINGFNFQNEPIGHAMNKAIIHRGPDNQNVWSSPDVTFGHARLSIIDTTDAGNQPFHYHVGSSVYTIVFNGEIYNYLEIRETLKSNGYTFNTQSDTEVILAAYDYWGELCVNQFNGMWAFCIYDLQKEKLFCSRDRLGVKPFYYYYKNGVFIFSSELKAILEHSELKINSRTNINLEAVSVYFSSGIVPAPLTIFSDTYKLHASYNLWFDLKSKELYEYRYYAPSKQPLVHDKQEIFNELGYLFDDAVKLRMRSDVPVGSFLSGGIDSTAIVYNILRNKQIENFHTFSVGFEGAFDETKFINIACNSLKNISHHHQYYTKEMWEKDQDEYTFVYDEPFSDYSGYPTMHVSKMASECVTVVQSGDGGDEIFGGYPTYNRALIVERLKKIPRLIRVALSETLRSNNKAIFRPAKEAIKLSLYEKETYLAKYLQDERIYSDFYKDWTIEKLHECLEITNGDLAESLRMFDLLYNTLSNRFLIKVDKASMINSIEVRSAFLDYRFINFSLKIPAAMKYGINNNKIILKEYLDFAMPEIPKEILYRKKHGFTPPLRNWIKTDLFFSAMNEELEIIKPLNPEIYSFLKKITIDTNVTSDLEYLIRFQIFIAWYKKWVLN